MKKKLNYLVLDVNGDIRDHYIAKLVATSSGQKLFVFNDADITTESTAYRSKARVQRSDKIAIGPTTLIPTEISTDNTEYTTEEIDAFLSSISVDYRTCRILEFKKQHLSVEGDIAISVVYDQVNELGQVIKTQAKPEVSTYVYKAVKEFYTEEEYNDIKAEMLPRDLGDITLGTEFKDSDHIVVTQDGKTKKITGAKLKEEVVKNVVNETMIQEEVEYQLDTTMKQILEEKEQEYAPKIHEIENKVNENQSLVSEIDAKKANMNYVETILQNLATGSPKGTYADLATLQTAIPSGNNNIYITLDNGHWNYFNGSIWVDGGVYQAQKIENGSITPKKTNFFKRSKNYFDKETRTLNARINQSTGAVEVHASYDASDWIEVEPNTVYYTTFNYRTAWYDSNKSFISGMYNQTAGAITSPNNARYIRFSIEKNHVDAFQLEKGNVFTGYEPYSVTFDVENNIINGTIPVEKLTIATAGKNKFNKATRTLGMMVSPTSGALSANASYDVTDYIEIDASKIYHRTHANRIAWYDANKTFISGTYEDTVYVLIPPTSAAYIRLTIPKSAPDIFQFEEGNMFTGYEEYRQIINPKMLENYLRDVPSNYIEFKHLKDGLDKLLIPGKNMFNKYAVKPNTLVNTSSGLETYSEGYFSTDFILVEPNEVYTRNQISRMTLFDENKNFVIGDYGGTYSNTFTVPYNVKYIRHTLSAQLLVDTFQFEKGGVQTTYEPYGYKVNALNSGNNLDIYLINAIEDLTKKVISIRSDLNFSFMTDIHNSPNRENGYKFKVLGEVNKSNLVNFVGLGGDIVDGSDDALIRLHNTIRDANEGTVDVLACPGNHDTNFPKPNALVKAHEWYNIACRHMEGKVVFDENNPQSGYFFKDFKNAKIRVIVMNTSDYHVYGGDGKPLHDPISPILRNGQMQWLQHKALNFMDKGEDRTNWAVVVLSHAALNPGESSDINGRTSFVGIINAFMNGTTHSNIEDAGTIYEIVSNCDFTDQGPIDFICSINGHRHWDRVVNFVGLNRPSIAVASGNGEPRNITLPEGATIPVYGAKGSLNYECFDIFSIDRQARKIYATRFGAGNDRVIDY